MSNAVEGAMLERQSPVRAQTPMLLSGNHAVAWAARLARPQVVPVYPITPQTPILEKLTDFQAEGTFDAEILTPESEHSVLSACIPASLAGARVFTATASQGLLLMHELLHYASGARAAIVMANVNRTVASPWAFWPDQTDSLAQRDTGWIQFYSESAQESLDSVIQGFRIAEQVQLPVLVNHDAFYVSHALEAVQVPSQAMVDAYLPPYAPTMNPCECAFAKLKAVLRRRRWDAACEAAAQGRAAEEAALRRHIEEALREVRPADVQGWFRLCGWR